MRKSKIFEILRETQDGKLKGTSPINQIIMEALEGAETIVDIKDDLRYAIFELTKALDSLRLIKGDIIVMDDSDVNKTLEKLNEIKKEITDDEAIEYLQQQLNK